MSNPPTIIITGSSGQVGADLVSYFSKRGYPVRAFQRSAPAAQNPSVSYYPFDLADVRDRGFEGADYVIHCAYRPVISKRERESGKNIDIMGTQKIIEFARKYGAKIIFLSTLSAHVGAVSYYAQNKFRAEALFDAEKDLVLRLGLVMGGSGGLFGKITASLRRYKIIPLIGGGSQRARTIALDDLCKIIEQSMQWQLTGIAVVAHPLPVTMKEYYQGIAEKLGAKPFYVSVPLWLAYRTARMGESLGIHLPFTSQSILGLKDLRTGDAVSDLSKLEFPIKDYYATLKELRLGV